MKVLFAASEASPYIKVGGLGDVMGGLPKELVKKGIDARVVIPLYSAISSEMRKEIKYISNCYVNNSWRSSYCGIFTAVHDGVIYYFIDNEQYFKRDSIYGSYDDGEIFAFFSRAVLEVLPHINFWPDVINVNDWHTSMLPVYLNQFYRGRDGYKNIRTVLSIHNIEFQGKYDPYILGGLFGLDVSCKSLMMYDGDVNVLKGGIESVDMISTVSKKYAEEILYPEHSFGLHNILNPRKNKLRGIINGIDTTLFNPETDKNIKTNYNINSLRNKIYNKRFLQKSMALDDSHDVPVIGMVTRLTKQKGFDLFYDVINQMSDLPIQLVVLGTGAQEYENLMRNWENTHHDKVRGIIKYSNDIASQIYAGADMFLMPSKSEPCGLSQMIAMRYGTVPIVHTVGGLSDTVIAYNHETKQGTGITFQSFNSYDMLDAIKRAVELYYDKNNWRQLRKNAMSVDFSWNNPAEEYIAMYKDITGIV
ncbi:MAG: glycogen synthase GlgA [Clostridia bacterium]|nr:glycogen synthase GlgA [Clostridia bacterium]